MPRLLQVQKPTKEPVGLYFLKRQEIRFRGLYGPASLRERPENEKLVVSPERYSQLSELFFLDSDDQYGFDQLPGYRGGVAGDAKDNCAAFVSFDVGEAITERRSRFGASMLGWREVKALDTAQVVKEPRKVNLDVIVRFTLPRFNPLVVTCIPILGETMVGDEISFILRPAAGASEVTVWVKNRELMASLLESDLDPDRILRDARSISTGLTATWPCWRDWLQIHSS